METIYTFNNGQRVEAFLSKYSDRASYRYLNEDGTCCSKSAYTRFYKDSDND
jgi:hypothetical protein